MSSSARRVRRVTGAVRALWFISAVMTTGGVLLGFVAPLVDAMPAVLAVVRSGPLTALLESSPEGAQQLLAASAGALATILGVAFSMTLVTVQLAAAQYTPRLVGRLLEDRPTKIVLGSYLGTVAYLLLVLRTIHGVGEGREGFVPRVSVLLALALILCCLGLLAYFVHHLAASIQPTGVGARVVGKTIRGLERLASADGEDGDADEPGPPSGAVRLLSDQSGYVQLVHLDRLISALPRSVSCVRLDVAAGDYVLRGGPVATLWPCRELDPRESRAPLEAFALGAERTDDQDVLYGVRQLADIGLKALSPGVNDETTAVAIVNQLGSLLGAACEARQGPWRRRSIAGVTVFTPALTVRRLIEDGFAGLIRFSADHPRVLARIAEVLGHVAAPQPPGERRDAILAAAPWIEHAISRADLAPHEHRLLALRLAQLLAPRTRGPADRPHELH